MANEISYSDPITTALMQQLLGGSGASTTTTTSGGGVSPEILAQLQSVLAGIGAGGTVTAEGIPQVSAQITPEQLAAIFSQGAQQIPNLTAAFANAAGARSSNNSGLQLALTDLNEGLTRQAALLGQEQQKLSTDAAYRNSSLGLQASEINARMQMAAEAARAQLAAQMAQLQRQPQTQTQETKKTGGIDPTAMMLGGFALNQANKGDWLGRILGTADKQDGSNVPVFDASADWSAPELSAAPSLDATFGIDWQMPQADFNYFDPAAWSIPSIDANFGTDWGSSFTDYAAPNYDFSGSWDFGGLGDSLSGIWDSFSDVGTDWGSSFDWFGADNWAFADGGQPARQRNRANMGTPGTRMLSGVGNRDASLSPGLIAPINFPKMPQVQMPRQLPERPAPQQQQAQKPQAAARPAPRELKERDTQSSFTANPDNTGSPELSSAIKSGLGSYQALGPLRAPLGLPSLGGVPGLVGAQNNEQALRAAAVTMLGIANPVLGLVASALIPKPKPPAPPPAAPQPPAAVAAPPAQQAPAVDPAQQYAWSDQWGWGSGNGNVNFSDRGPGGSSGDPAAAAGGATPYGPGGYESQDNDAPTRNTGRDNGGSFGGTNNSAGSGFGGSGPGPRGFAADGGQPARGLIQGPGTGTSDSIKMPAISVSNGEYILSADVVKALGVETLDALQAAFHTPVNGKVVGH